jgi:hypothetical protein
MPGDGLHHIQDGNPMRSTYWTTLAAALVLGQAACTVDKAADESRGTREAYAQTPAAGPNLVTITTTEYAFAAPASIPAGLTTVRLVNQGKEMHHVQLVRLAEGHTVAELMEIGHDEPIPAWVTFVGGPNAHAPGAHSEATVQLEAGSYALVCLIPSPDGVPHIAKGMVKPLTVTPASGEAQAPASDVRLTLTDYAFEFAPELTAGRHTLHVTNAASQPHDAAGHDGLDAGRHAGRAPGHAHRRHVAAERRPEQPDDGGRGGGRVRAVLLRAGRKGRRSAATCRRWAWPGARPACRPASRPSCPAASCPAPGA